MRIAVVAPSCPLDQELPARVTALASERLGGDAPEIVFHPQCFESDGHFAGPDKARIAALVEVANDPSFDAVWCARGGYGACRVAEPAIRQMSAVARDKLYMGYSDAGFLLGCLYARGIGRVAHGPMPNDLNRDDGDEAVLRALNWFLNPDTESPDTPLETVGLSPPLTGYAPRKVAFNLTVLEAMLGTPLMPDLTDHVLMIEDTGEYLYRTDRSLFHLTSSAAIRAVAGIRMGRFSDVLENDRDFGQDVDALVRHWCGVAGIAFLGYADIGHDAANIVVPFG